MKKTVVVRCGNRLLGEAIARILLKKDFQVLPAQADADVLVVDSVQLCPQAPVPVASVLVGMEDNHEHFLAAVRRGVRDYVLRTASAADVVVAVRSVAQGHAACPPEYMRLLFDCIVSQRSASTAGASVLTRREQQILPLLDRGLTNKEIASQLYISEQTVKNHVHRIMRKMGASNRVEVCTTWQRQAYAPALASAD